MCFMIEVGFGLRHSSVLKSRAARICECRAARFLAGVMKENLNFVL